MRALLLIVSVLLICCAGVRAADAVAPEVTLPDLPKAYQDYMIDPDSVSPNGQYAVMYPSAVPDDDNAVIKNFIVALKPFRVVVQLPKGDDSYCAHRNHADFAANWAKDSSVVVVMDGSRFGPGQVYVVPIVKGQAGKIAELTAEVTKFVQPDLNKVMHERFNENYDFLFIGDNDWKVNDKGQVVVAVDCSTNPKGLEDIKTWEGSFEGLWDIAQGKFVTHKFTRTFVGVHPSGQ